MTDIFAGYGIAIAILAIMVSIAGILIGLGYAIEDKKLKEAGRSELYQTLINAAIIGVLFVAFSQYGIITAVVNGLAQGTGPQSCGASMGYNSAICFAYNYLVGSAAITVNGNQYPSLMSSVLSLFIPLTVLYSVVATIASLNINIVVISVALTGLGVFLSPLKGMIDFLAASMFLIIAQAALLKFVAITAVSAILPVGLVLRTFFFTRKLGGTLIAIAIGFFAVFPLTYVFDAQLLATFANGSIGPAFSSLLSEINSVTSSTQSISSTAYGIAQSQPTTAGNTIYVPPNPIPMIFSALSNLSNVFSTLLGLFENVLTFLIIQAFILPAFSLILTVISVRELARILGSEISFGRFDIF